MSRKYFYWVMMAFLFTACRKSNYVPFVMPVPPVLPDSLIQWKEMGVVPGSFTGDIWFISPAIGFTAGSELFQTADSGKTWTAVPGTSGTPGFYNLFFTDSYHGFAEGASQMAFTTDGGRSWTIKSLPTTKALTLFFVNSSTGFYAGNDGGGLYKTSDAGSNWTNVFISPTTSDDYYPYFLNPDTGFVVTSSSLFETTTDGGQTWTFQGYLNFGSAPGAYNQLQFLDEYNGFYGYSAGILKTTDGGKSWKHVFSQGAVSFVSVIKFFNAQTGYFKASDVIYYTTDGGETWAISCKIGSDSFIGMNFIDAHTGWACTNKGRVFRIQL